MSCLGFRLALLWAAFTLLSSSAFSAPTIPVNLPLLRDVICEKESRTVKTPERAIRHRLKRDAEGRIMYATVDVGFCQINVKKLEDMGFLAPLGKAAYRDPAIAFTRWGSEAIALEILAWTQARHPSFGKECLYIKYRWGGATRCTKHLMADPDVIEVAATYNERMKLTVRR